MPQVAEALRGVNWAEHAVGLRGGSKDRMGGEAFDVVVHPQAQRVANSDSDAAMREIDGAEESREVATAGRAEATCAQAAV